MKEWGGDEWWEWWVYGTDGRSATHKTRWVRNGEICAWLMETPPKKREREVTADRIDGKWRVGTCFCRRTTELIVIDVERLTCNYSADWPLTTRHWPRPLIVSRSLPGGVCRRAGHATNCARNCWMMLLPTSLIGRYSAGRASSVAHNRCSVLSSINLSIAIQRGAKQVSAVANWPARQSRAVDRALTICAINYSGRASELWGIINSVDRRRCSLSRSGRPPLETIDMLWWNFISPEFGVKSQREVPLFLKVPEFPYNTV